MKTFLFSAIVLASLAMTSSVLAECSRSTADYLKYNPDSIAEDLIGSAWTTDVLGADAEVFFHQDGILEYIQTDTKSPKLEFMQWEVRIVDGTAVLSVSANNGSSRSLLIRPICEGFTASNAFGIETEILMQAKQRSGKLDLTRDKMTGVWKSSAKRSTGMRDLKWDLKSDGTFTLAVAPDMYHATHQGVWDITSDGQYLLLYFTRDNNPENVYTREIVRIKSVDFEDLVLDVHDLPMIFDNGLSKVVERDFVKDFSM
jgi:hypothetical protein